MPNTSLANFTFKLKDLFDRILQARQEMAWILTGQLLGLAGGFVSIKVLTNIMGPEGYGQLALGLTIAGILNMYVYGPVANIAARFFAAYREKKELAVYFSVLKKFHKVSGVTITVLAVVAGAVAHIWVGREWAIIIMVSLLFGIVSGVNASYLFLLNAIRERKVVALHQGADVWLRVGLSVAFLYLFRNTGYVALLGYLMGTFLVTVSQSLFALKNEEIRRNWHKASASGRPEMDTSREFLGYATPFVLFAGFGAISMFADRWIIQGLFGEGDVGIYYAIYSIANAPITLLFTIANQLMVPIIFERAGTMTTMAQAESSASLLRITVILATLVVLLISLIAYLFSEPLVRIFTSKVFAAHHSILWVSVLGLSLFNIGQLLSIKGLYFNQPNIYLWPKGLQAGSFLLLAYFLARQFGIIGVALSLFTSAIIYLISVVIVNNRIDIGIK